jgi:hypothetical protein
MMARLGTTETAPEQTMLTDPLSEIVGVDLSQLNPVLREGGTIAFRARVDDREVEGEYSSAEFRIRYKGRTDGGGPGILGDLTGRSHAHFAAPLQGLIAWLNEPKESRRV